MRWLRRFWHRPLTERQLESELTFHLEQQIAAYTAAGMSAEEARRRANLEFGGLERFKEECRETRPETHVHAFFYDLRYACRSLSKDLRFSLLVIFALTLGIGCSTIIFSIVYNGVLHPFPYKHADRLAALYVRNLAEPEDNGNGRTMFTLAEIQAFQEKNRTFEEIAGWSNWWVLYSNGKGTERLHGCRVTPNAFEFFGVTPLLGRIITPEDAKPGAAPVAVIDYRLWRRLFNSDPNVVGTKLTLDQNAVTIVGVMPRRFTADGGDLWSPTPLKAEESLQERFDNEPRFFFASGIIKAGVSKEAAGADLNVIAKQFSAPITEFYPKQFSMGAKLLSDAVIGDFKAILYFLVFAVVMLLLISCSNVANLLLARSTAREREIALRASLGASRGRLARQLLTEALVLAVGACLSGCVFAYAGLKWMVTHLPPRVPGEADVSLNLPVLGFAILVSVGTVFLCGLSPALHAVRGNYQSKLVGVGAVSTSFRQSKLRSGLVVAEIALSVVLLVCAGLTLRSFLALTHVQLGYDPDRVLAAMLSFPKGRYNNVPEKRAYFDEVLRRVSTVPGVVAAATSITVPTEYGAGSLLTIPGKVHTERWGTALDLCSEGIFRVLDFKLLKGRVLTPRDIAESRRVVVVSETFARKYFPSEEPIGQRFKLNAFDRVPDSPRDAYFEIVGIVSDARTQGGLSEPQIPQVYLPFTVTSFDDRWLLLRTSVEPLSVVNEVREQVWSVDREVAFTGAEGLNAFLSRAYFAAPQFALFAISAFAAVGLVLVVIGVFGLMAYTVSLQKHEIGVRMALGAQTAVILKMVLVKGLRLISAGMAVGVAAALVVGYLLRHQFWHFSPADPLIYSAVCAILVVVGLLACWVPARRATRIDPITALRYE
jgi:predicted permease